MNLRGIGQTERELTLAILVTDTQFTELLLNGAVDYEFAKAERSHILFNTLLIYS